MISYGLNFHYEFRFFPPSPGISILNEADLFLTPAFLFMLACYHSSNLELNVCVKTGTGIRTFTPEKMVGGSSFL